MRKPRISQSPEQRAERIEEEAEQRESARKAADANVQKMIERSIKEHGA